MLGKKPKVLPAQPEVDGVVRQHLEQYVGRGRTGPARRLAVDLVGVRLAEYLDAAEREVPVVRSQIPVVQRLLGHDVCDGASGRVGLQTSHIGARHHRRCRASAPGRSRSPARRTWRSAAAEAAVLSGRGTSRAPAGRPRSRVKRLLRSLWPRWGNVPGDRVGRNVSGLTGPVRSRTLPTSGPRPQATITSTSEDVGRANRGGPACRRAAPVGS